MLNHPFLCRCPFDAIQIFNLPTNLDSQVTHRYTANSFKLHRLPTPRPGQVLGLVGTNGIGKSTALKILAGKVGPRNAKRKNYNSSTRADEPIYRHDEQLKPNLGRYEDPPEWTDILKHFRGSELQNFFTKVLEDNIKAIVKPQYVDLIPRQIKKEGMTVSKMLDAKAEREGAKDLLAEQLELTKLMDREIGQLSGGELQRFAIALAAVQQADV
jgi:ATP-binding cassette subfamily E protein 1